MSILMTKTTSRWGGIEKIAQSDSWKKGKEKGGGIKAKVVTVADLLMKEDNDKQTIIIDMRSKETKVLSNLNSINDTINYEDDGLFTSNAQLGIEFLYNLNQIYEHVQTEVDKDSRSYSIQSKRIDAIKQNIHEIENQLDRDQPRLDRLEKLYKVLERVYETQQRSPDAVTIDAIIRLFQTLYTSFTEEFRLFGILQLLPSMVDPIIQNKIKDWEPLEDPFVVTDLFNAWSTLISFYDDNGESSLRSDVIIVQESIGNKVLVPLIQRAITNSWDCRKPDACVHLVTGLKQVISVSMFEQFIETVILPKLTAAVEAWNPQEDIHIHTWLHPWLPLLGSKLSVLYPEIRRKISKRLGDWHPSDNTAQSMLQPWTTIFDKTSLCNLVIRSIVPKLIVCIRGMTIDPTKDDDLKQFQWIVLWHQIIPHMHFISLLAGELFPRWLLALGKCLSSYNDNGIQWQTIVNWYLKWKALFPQEVLVDEEIIRYLNVALEMMASALDSSSSSPNKCIRGYMKSLEECSYFQLLEMKRLKADITERLQNLNYKATTTYDVKFHEVIESFATENDIEFYLTERKTDDHNIYKFGLLDIFIDSNVIFCNKGKDYVPVSLDDLLVLNRQ